MGEGNITKDRIRPIQQVRGLVVEEKQRRKGCEKEKVDRKKMDVCLRRKRVDESKSEGQK